MSKFFNVPGRTAHLLFPGTYKIECWGAQGGFGSRDAKIVTPGGSGAYVSGNIIIHRKTPLFLYVGGAGKNGSATTNTYAEGGFNGGGKGGSDTYNDDGSGGGGGATDVRLVGGDWNNEYSLYSRIMVAAGGSGSAYDSYGAPGGTICGYISTDAAKGKIKESTTCQTSGNAPGIGANGKNHDILPSSGSGGGYYGGVASDAVSQQPWYKAVSSSGSSFVSGCDGCKAVDEKGHTLYSNVHYSGKKFFNIVMKNGLQEETNGNGKIKITLIKAFTINKPRKLKISILFYQLIVCISS